MLVYDTSDKNLYTNSRIEQFESAVISLLALNSAHKITHPKYTLYLSNSLHVLPVNRIMSYDTLIRIARREILIAMTTLNHKLGRNSSFN